MAYQTELLFFRLFFKKEKIRKNTRKKNAAECNQVDGHPSLSPFRFPFFLCCLSAYPFNYGDLRDFGWYGGDGVDAFLFSGFLPVFFFFMPEKRQRKSSL